MKNEIFAIKRQNTSIACFVALFINVTQFDSPQQKWSTVNKAQTLDVTLAYTHVSNKFHTFEEIFLICLRQ